ncbi:hypothetical protein A3J90_03515 [candidate division WOR-1 bacterium RIFOXYC2_FULL_37_10]|nr:MAG: hypothetical protein A2246_02405 [candidate division WOR-1 bacterium RIFOXYA2_FULL_37_7]OGC33524.1 MAG: hypothetical protein A3J90_03515 [candidate division WOR-1 bacterium RIFOXYC2_FULL_37_10]
MPLNQTPLYEEHVKLTAKIVPFAGWEMPVLYKSIIDEHNAVRSSVGIFDAGHMGVIDIWGSDSLIFLLKIGTNNAAKLGENEIQYSILCNEQGGAIDDILVYRLKNKFRIVANASNTEKVLKHFESTAKSLKVSIHHQKDLHILSLQGPKSHELVKNFTNKKNTCQKMDGLLVSRTGYTGEDGFELFAPKEKCVQIWNNLINRGAIPCGLGARDTLRLEAGLPLYGHEYNEETTPLEVGYGWAVKFDDHDFIGKKALLKQTQEGLKKKLVGLKFHDKAIPRQGVKIYSGDKEIGVVTSGTFSPSLKIPVALGFVTPEFAKIGNIVEAEIRDKKFQAVVSSKKLL